MTTCADVMAAFAAMYQDYRGLPVPIRDDTIVILHKHWRGLYHPVYLIAYLVHPKYYTGGINKNARDSARESAVDLFKAFFPLMIPSNVLAFEMQWLSYLSASAPFHISLEAARTQANPDPPGLFWARATHSPELAMFATRVLSITPTPAAAERCWSGHCLDSLTRSAATGC